MTCQQLSTDSFDSAGSGTDTVGYGLAPDLSEWDNSAPMGRGEEIKRRREALNVSQAELATLAGIKSGDTVSRAENDKKVKPRTYAALESVLAKEEERQRQRDLRRQGGTASSMQTMEPPDVTASGLLTVSADQLTQISTFAHRILTIVSDITDAGQRGSSASAGAPDRRDQKAPIKRAAADGGTR